MPLTDVPLMAVPLTSMPMNASAPDPAVLADRLAACASWEEVRADAALADVVAVADAQETVFPVGSCAAARDAAVERLAQAFPGLGTMAARRIVALLAA